ALGGWNSLDGVRMAGHISRTAVGGRRRDRVSVFFRAIDRQTRDRRRPPAQDYLRVVALIRPYVPARADAQRARAVSKAQPRADQERRPRALHENQSGRESVD